MMATREQLRNLVGRLFDVELCADEVLAYIERGAPALRYYLELKASGRIPQGRAAFGFFLQSVPESLFGHLLEHSIAFFRRSLVFDEDPSARDPELSGLAGCLWADEKYLDTITGTDEEMRHQMAWFSNLIQLEEQQRAGAQAWLDHYPTFAGVDVGPLRFPVREWIEPN